MSGARDYWLPRDALANARLRDAGLAPCCIAGEEMIFKPDLKEVIKNTRPADLIGYWPLDEQRGSVAHDHAGQRRNGAHVGVDLGKMGVGDGRTCPYYDGTGDYTNIFSASLAATFSGAEGTAVIFAKVTSAGVWTDGNQRNVLSLTTDVNNRVEIRKAVANNQMELFRRAGGIWSSFGFSDWALTWQALSLTWSVAGGKVVAYANGKTVGINRVLGTWAGPLANTGAVIGASSTTPTTVWLGYLAHCAIWRSALSPVEIYNIAQAAGLAAA